LTAHTRRAHIGKAELSEQPLPPVAQLRFDPAELGAQLIAHLRNRRPHLVEIKLGAAQLASIFDKRLRHLRTERAKHEIDRGLKESTISP
jgi:hypothetical protein